jgi:hypothetical protein
MGALQYTTNVALELAPECRPHRKRASYDHLPRHLQLRPAQPDFRTMRNPRQLTERLQFQQLLSDKL